MSDQPQPTADRLESGIPDTPGVWIPVAELEAMQAQLAAANSRLAKVREALTRLGEWTELSPFAESILAEAQAALAEGEWDDE